MTYKIAGSKAVAVGGVTIREQDKRHRKLCLLFHGLQILSCAVAEVFSTTAREVGVLLSE
jgi:hypothetical protein